MRDIAPDIRTLVDSSAGPVTTAEVRSRVEGGAPDTRVTARRYRGLRPGAVLVAVSSLVAATVLVVVLLPAGGPVPHPGPTPPPGPSVTGRWQLTASLSGADYVLATGNPGAISTVSCGGVTTCFLSTYYGVGGASSVTGATYVSHDAGHSWSASTLPPGVAVATAVSCVSATWCSAGGGLLDPKSGDPLAKKEMRDPVLLTTTDAGVRWTMHKVPIPPAIEQIPAYRQFPAETTYWPGILDAVACTSPGVCDVVGHVLDATSDAPVTPFRLEVLRTTDGGVTWSRTVLPERPAESGFELSGGLDGTGAAISCPSAGQCVVLAEWSLLRADGVVDAWRSTDSGRTWRETQVAGAQQIGSSLTCPTTRVCWGGPSANDILHSVDGGATWSLVPVPEGVQATSTSGTGFWDSVSCTSATSCVLGGQGMQATTDGAATWSTVPLPAQVGAVPSVSCQLAGFCVALADTAGGYPFNGGSLVLTNGPSPAGATASSGPS